MMLFHRKPAAAQDRATVAAICDREEFRAVAHEGLSAAAAVLKLVMAAQPKSASDALGFMLAKGYSLEVVYGGILGHALHMRIMIAGPDGAAHELSRFAFTQKENGDSMRRG